MIPLLGPLLGHVTTDTAIAWVRLPRHARVDLVEAESRPLAGLRAGDPGGVRIAPLPAIPGGDGTACGSVRLAGGPGVLHRIDLRTRAEGRRPPTPLGSLLVRTAPPVADHGRVAFAFGSCWKFDALGDSGAAWDALAALAAARHVDHLLLLGDQIYADESPLPTSAAGRTATGHVKHLGPGSPLAQRAEGYRDAYQAAWEPEGVRHVLSCLPSASMWDDHEILDGFGSEAWHREADGRAYFEAASLAFDEFQGSRNPPRMDESSRAHAFRRGPAAFLTLDLRTNRDVARGIVLGEEQRRAVAAWLASPAARAARVLFLSSSVPLLHLSRAFHWLRGRSDLLDQWSSAANEPERAWLLRQLLDYEEGGRRAVVMLGGDSHLATAASATGRDGRIRWQVTSSPLAQRLPAIAYPALNLFGRRFRVRVAGEPEEKLQAHVIRRWRGPNVGVVVGEATPERVDLTFELFRPGRRTEAVALVGRLAGS